MPPKKKKPSRLVVIEEPSPSSTKKPVFPLIQSLSETKETPLPEPKSEPIDILMANAEEYNKLYPSTQNTHDLITYKKSAIQKLIEDLKNYCLILNDIDLSTKDSFDKNEDKELIFLLKLLSDFSLDLITDFNEYRSINPNNDFDQDFKNLFFEYEKLEKLLIEKKIQGIGIALLIKDCSQIKNAAKEKTRQITKEITEATSKKTKQIKEQTWQALNRWRNAISSKSTITTTSNETKDVLQQPTEEQPISQEPPTEDQPNLQEHTTEDKSIIQKQIPPLYHIHSKIKHFPIGLIKEYFALKKIEKNIKQENLNSQTSLTEESKKLVADLKHWVGLFSFEETDYIRQARGLIEKLENYNLEYTIPQTPLTTAPEKNNQETIIWLNMLSDWVSSLSLQIKERIHLLEALANNESTLALKALHETAKTCRSTLRQKHTEKREKEAEPFVDPLQLYEAAIRLKPDEKSIASLNVMKDLYNHNFTVEPEPIVETKGVQIEQNSQSSFDKIKRAISKRPPKKLVLPETDFEENIPLPDAHVCRLKKDSKKSTPELDKLAKGKIEELKGDGEQYVQTIKQDLTNLVIDFNAKRKKVKNNDEDYIEGIPVSYIPIGMNITVDPINPFKPALETEASQILTQLITFGQVLGKTPTDKDGLEYWWKNEVTKLQEFATSIVNRHKETLGKALTIEYRLQNSFYQTSLKVLDAIKNEYLRIYRKHHRREHHDLNDFNREIFDEKSLKLLFEEEYDLFTKENLITSLKEKLDPIDHRLMKLIDLYQIFKTENVDYITNLDTSDSDYRNKLMRNLVRHLEDKIIEKISEEERPFTQFVRMLIKTYYIDFMHWIHNCGQKKDDLLNWWRGTESSPRFFQPPPTPGACITEQTLRNARENALTQMNGP